jgi:hypothetical protein
MLYEVHVPQKMSTLRFWDCCECGKTDLPHSGVSHGCSCFGVDTPEDHPHLPLVLRNIHNYHIGIEKTWDSSSRTTTRKSSSVLQEPLYRTAFVTYFPCAHGFDDMRPKLPYTDPLALHDPIEASSLEDHAKSWCFKSQSMDSDRGTLERFVQDEGGPRVFGQSRNPIRCSVASLPYISGKSTAAPTVSTSIPRSSSPVSYVAPPNQSTVSGPTSSGGSILSRRDTCSTVSTAPSLLVSQDSNGLYNYIPLLKQDSIRLLRILPGSKTLPLSFHMEEATLENPISYEAISYAWGSDSVQVPLSRSGHAIIARKTLSQASQTFRHENQLRLLWIDSICINQADKEERGHQIVLMQSMNTKDRSFVVWLGRQQGEHAAIEAYGAIRSKKRRRSSEQRRNQIAMVRKVGACNKCRVRKVAVSHLVRKPFCTLVKSQEFY